MVNAVFRQGGGKVLRHRAQGAQRASMTGWGAGGTRFGIAQPLGTSGRLALASPRSFIPVRAVAAVLLAAIVAAGGMTVLVTSGARAEAGAGMKAVIIVGPASSSTWQYLDEGEHIARQAAAQGMDVRRIFTPRATWKRVKQNIQGANLVVYLGHGNGWPSPMGPFRGESKDGLGLNPCEDTCGTSSPTKYWGEDFIRSDITLAPKSVVMLHRLCYASGNGEGWMAPVFDRELATQRVSNFASGFLDAGASAVFALAWRQKIDLPAALATTNKTIDEIFMTQGTPGGEYADGFVGWDDYYRTSVRTDGAQIHLDPHPQHGHLRAVTGDLAMTAGEWRGGSPPPDGGSPPRDGTPPTLEVRSAGTTDDPTAAGAGSTVTFSPNGDGVADRLVVDRTLSEPAYIDIDVRNETGDSVRQFTRFDEAGEGRTFWDGRNDADAIVRDGLFRLRMTPRDRAGNVGDTTVVDVRVLTSLSRLEASADAINVSDGDDLAAFTELTARLRRDAMVTWQIRGDGSVVRTRFADKRVAAGDLSWRWDGTDDSGATVPDGTYKALISATTEDGLLRYSVPIYVGNWRFDVTDPTPSRGKRLRVIVRSTEPLKAAPTLEITLPGREPQTVKMRLIDPHQAAVAFKPSRKAKAGEMVLKVRGLDKGGQEEVGDLTLPLR
jgi:flagellar hook assembly protein FlgD